MLEAMRELALLELNHRSGEADVGLDQIRARHGEQLAPLLVEAAEKIPRVYLLQAIPDQPGMARMWVEELDDTKRRRLPFNKPSGSQSSALGPVFKRTSKPKENPPYGPSLKIQNTTAREFATQSQGDTTWSGYFEEICGTLFRSHTLEFGGKSHAVGSDQPDPHALAAAVRLIPEAKETVFLSVVDSKGCWPGDRAEYQSYLAHALADIKYVTGEAPAHGPADCPLCGAIGVTLYPNLRGTGINFANMDRAGAFPGVDTGQAWKGYGLCLDCADLLYVFKNHLLGHFLGSVAGDKALLLPSLLGNEEGKRQFLEDWRRYLESLGGNKIASHEKDLLEFVQDRNDAQVVLHILWATFGQVIDDVRGVINDILPSRLSQLAKRNAEANGWKHALAPRYVMAGANFDLGLNVLLTLFKRPGGRKANKANDSARLFNLKRQLAESLYHGKTLGEVETGLWREILLTAEWYLNDLPEDVSVLRNYLLNQGVSNKGDKQTLANWIRQLARFLHYLDITGVLLMDPMTEPFEPALDALKPYFQPGSGLNSREKAFTFMLGILYGKVLQVQAARRVNVASNALTWLKRLNLDGRDLPALYNKIREKLLTYETEANADVRTLVEDLGRLGGKSLGDNINLDNTTTCYFLLLGQSVTVDVLPSKASKNED
ncbi:MAG: TM1802 family CRISPR-associated protein [Candidatus Contendobacter sp.]|nr:TM1802 family CRISPR-associated protein [Candidatus Contendobacter sp.]